jgi:hypothetical protein
MPQRQWLFVAVMALVVSGIVVGERLSIPAPYQKTLNSGGKSTKEETSNIAPPETADDRIAQYTLLLAIFTGALVVVSAVQINFLIRSDKTARISADAARKTVSTMEATAAHQLRAYVYVADASILEANSGYRPNIRITFQNYGQTPAYQVRNTSRFSVVRTENAEHFVAEVEVTSHQSDFGPSQDKSTNLVIPHAVWTIERQMILSRNGIGVAYGEITYFDAFQNRASAQPRFTRYRFQIPVDDEGITDGPLVFSEEGNESS